MTVLINKEHLLSQLENRPPDGWISVQAVRAMIEKEPEAEEAKMFDKIKKSFYWRWVEKEMKE